MNYNELLSVSHTTGHDAGLFGISVALLMTPVKKPRGSGFGPPRLPAPLPARRAYRPEGRAYSSERGVIWVITFTSSVQVSGVRCQQPKLTRWVGVAHKMDFLTPVLAFSYNPISVQDSIFPDT